MLSVQRKEIAFYSSSFATGEQRGNCPDALLDMMCASSGGLLANGALLTLERSFPAAIAVPFE